jgi:dynein heavy chain
MDESGLQKNDEFNLKIIQLHETILVRHGLMMVGAAMSSKTSILDTLAKAYEYYRHDGSKVIQHIMNPKSVTIGQLYGDFEKVTRDWIDGIVGLAVREAAADKTDDRHWILLDGPVDAVWIENMNTVLDDNKKLCLTSGEIIKLTEYMTMMFEVEDLKQASPATVSRCGMVYVSAENLGWQV